MSDEPQATLEENENSAEQQQAQEDWEQRYKETQASFTRTQQEIASLRDDPNALYKFLEEHHPDLLEPEAEPEPEYEDPDEAEQPLTRAEFEEWKREQAQTAQARSSQQQFEADFKTVLNGREITKHGDRAIRYALEQGEIRNADDLKKAVDEWFEEVAPPKSKPRVPHAVTGGQAATQVPDWDNMSQGEINQYMAERVRGHEAQT